MTNTYFEILKGSGTDVQMNRHVDADVYFTYENGR